MYETLRPDRDGGCVFCDIATGAAPADVVRDWGACIAFTPLNPRVAGHVLVVPRAHVRDFVESPSVTALVAMRAAEYAVDVGDANLITSRGAAATQTVPHLHMHVVPRVAGDGLALPWTGQLDAT